VAIYLGVSFGGPDTNLTRLSYRGARESNLWSLGLRRLGVQHCRWVVDGRGRSAQALADIALEPTARI